jgi:hypothetical protein
MAQAGLEKLYWIFKAENIPTNSTKITDINKISKYR